MISNVSSLPTVSLPETVAATMLVGNEKAQPT